MDRLQKKCAIASTGLHLLLLLILMVGPAFFASSSRIAPDMTVLDFVPLKTVDELMSGGGNPKAQPPPAAQALPPQPQAQLQPPPPAPKPEPQPPKEPEPAPPKEQAKAPLKKPEPVSDSLEASDRPPKKEFNFVRVKTNTALAAKQKSDAEKQAKEYAAARKRMAQEVGRAAAALGNGLSSGVSIDVNEFKGPGGGGVPYANFLQAVMSAYDRAWFLPAGVTDNDASALVEVTIARDGTVVAKRIIRPSGNSEVDRSVQSAIDRVKYAAPLPEGAKENQRKVEINFNVRAKRLLG